MNTKEVITVYRQRIQTLEDELKLLKQKKNTISWVRFGVTIITVFFIWRFRMEGWLFIVLPAIVWLAIFLRLIIIASRNKAAIQHRERLIFINEQEIAVADGQYTGLPDGSQYKAAVHDYSNDLDIFGRASLYQYINRTISEQGNAYMASKLLKPSAVADILATHAAVKELAPQYAWRQDLQACGIEDPIMIRTQHKIASWLQEPYLFIGEKGWQILRVVFPIIALSTLVLYLTDVISSPQFWGLVVLYISFSGAISRKIMAQYVSLNKIVGQVTTLSRSLDCIESLEVKAPLLVAIKSFFVSDTYKASSEVKQLKSILDRFDIRMNPLVFLPLNAFLLWDLQLIFQLENWKQKNQHNAGNWFDKLGEIEFLNSIANLHFNFSEWAFPGFVEEHGRFDAKELGHPLIPAKKRVSSDFAIQGTPQLALVTGSNMAGKSTFLRSAGTNIVLAMMGAPVCASACTLSPMRVISTMRVADNLEESTSTFYAELKKLQYIIEAVNRNEKVFLLFDEILRGTNSADRHLGSEALIKQLMAHNATGILATHDLELTKLVEAYPNNIHNYHFDMQIRNDNELFFDYKLKEGICQSMNAAFLMKMIGIEM